MKEGSPSQQISAKTSGKVSPRHTAWSAFRVVVIIATCYFLVTFWPAQTAWEWVTKRLHISSQHVDSAGASSGAFNWLETEASEDLVWHSCWDNLFQCARLSVPMNWNNLSDPSRVQIALVKLPAQVPITDDRYGGALLLNPGGPGNSGIYQVLSGGPQVQTIVDPADGQGGKFFDIIGFDPRAVNNTTPHLTCFPDGIAEARWFTEKPSERFLQVDKRALDENWERTRALGVSCAADRGNTTNVVRYANTAQVVEDMVAIVEKHGKWREAEAHKLLAQSDGIAVSDKAATLERARWHKGTEPLNFWGISYGTVLGQTFAAMHPNRSNRLILDGVVDIEDYQSAKWLTGLYDTDKILAQWGDYCFEAGEACPLTVPGDGLPAFFFARLARAISNLLESPLPIDTERGPAVIDYDYIMDLLTLALYAPHRYIETFIRVVNQINHGNGSALSEWKAKDTQTLTVNKACERDGPFSEACLQSTHWIHSAVVCADADDIRDHTKDDFLKYLAKMEKDSDIMGSTWSLTMMDCINWPARAAWRFEGPFSATTAHPILFIGNSYDPVTPLRSAQTASELFPGSVVLRVNMEGHSSCANPSICSAKAIRAYLQDGTLPSHGTVCEPELRPWVGCVSPGGCRDRSPEDQVLFEALESLTVVWPDIDWPALGSSG